MLFWVGKITEALPITGSGKNLQIKIKLRDPQFMYLFQKFDTTQTNDPNGANPISNNFLTTVAIPLQDVRLTCHKNFVPKGERSVILSHLDSSVGYNWKTFDLEFQKDIRVGFAQNKNSIQIPLVAFKGACTTLFITKIHSLDKQTPFATFWTNFLRLNDFSLTSGKDSIIPLQDHFYNTTRIHILFNNAKLNTAYNIYAHNYSLVPSDKFNAWGHLELGKFLFFQITKTLV